MTLGEPNGVRHTVEVQAESLFEAAALGLAALKHDGWVPPPGKAARLEVFVMEQVKHTVSVERVLKWLDGVTTSPRDLLKRERLKAMIG